MPPPPPPPPSFPPDPFQAAQCDSVYELAWELTAGTRNVNPIVNMYTGEKEEEAKAAYFKEFTPRYPQLFTYVTP